jgi:hypothetical protein
MSERGVFAVDRGIWEHPMFHSRDPFSRREAWMWLISEAAWKPRRYRAGSIVVQLERGQLAHSLRYLADCWGWSVKRVRGLIDDLTQEHMIATATDTGVTVITICKYAEYQRVSLPEGTAEDTGSDTAKDTEADTQRAHEGHRKEDIKNIKTDIRAVAMRRAPVNLLRFEEFWAEYPKRDGSNPKKPALKVYEQAVKSGTDEQTIIDGAKRYRADLRRRGQEGTQYVAQAVTWLRQARWTDDLPAPGGSGNNPSPITVGTQMSALLKGVVASPDEDWDKWMRGYTSMPPYSRSWYGPGAPPGSPGCEVPAEIQRKYGFTPVPWVRRSDGTEFGVA